MMRQWLENHFGSRRAALRFMKHWLKFRLGAYRQYTMPDLEGVDRLVFVCTGNICRSPFGQFLATRSGLASISVGTSTRGGDPANPDALRMAQQFGIDLSDHVSQRLQDTEFTDRDLFVCMEPIHADAVCQQLPDARVTLIGLWHSPKRPYIPDPYNRSDEYFQRCFSWIESAIDQTDFNQVVTS